MKIAIIGATSHVAQNLIIHLAADTKLFLFARSIGSLKNFLSLTQLEKSTIHIRQLDLFGIGHEQFDAVINCVGFGTPEKVKTAGIDLFRVTEYYDNLILDHIIRHPETVYINFSSGAVYGTEHTAPISSKSEFTIPLDAISGRDAYRISKLNAETKHRSMEGFSIYDLRLFSFFSRYIDLSSSYLVVEMVKAIMKKSVFVTNYTDIIRDFIHPQDLVDLVKRCILTTGYNKPLDVYSKAPVKKSEIIKNFVDKFGLKYAYAEDCTPVSPTGIKSHYVSANHEAGKLLKFTPQYESLECLLSETDKILNFLE